MCYVVQTEQHRRQQKLAADMAASHAAHQREQAQQGELAPPAQLLGSALQVRPLTSKGPPSCNCRGSAQANP